MSRLIPAKHTVSFDHSRSASKASGQLHRCANHALCSAHDVHVAPPGSEQPPSCRLLRVLVESELARLFKLNRDAAPHALVVPHPPCDLIITTTSRNGSTTIGYSANHPSVSWMTGSGSSQPKSSLPTLTQASRLTERACHCPSCGGYRDDDVASHGNLTTE